MDWSDLRAFIVLADKETFTHAAREQGVSVATLTRKMDRLEADLGIPLVRRSPAGVAVTPEGHRILSLARQGGDYLGQIERVANAIGMGASRDPVRISSTEPVIADLLAPRAAEFQRKNPHIQLDLMVSTEVSNLQRHEADLAIRLSRPVELTLVARKLGEIKMAVFSAQSLLASRGDSTSWRELPFMSFNDGYGSIPETSWFDYQGLKDNICFMSSSTRAQLHACQAGLGAAILPSYLAQNTDLVQIDAPPVPSRPLWLVFHKDMQSQPAIKHVKSWIVDACKTGLNNTGK